MIVACHFLSSFGVLGMAPYYPLVVERSFQRADSGWGAVLYVLPLTVMAVAGPLWGLFADRFGKRLSLLRAQVGLALVLGLCGYTQSLPAFAACLILQGLFGGTYSASNALVATCYTGDALARALSWLQFSARLSLFAAPSVVGWLLAANPLHTYRWLWLLPAASFLVLLTMNPTRAVEPETAPRRSGTGLPWAQVVALEFGFTVATVVTFPYFVKAFPGPERLAGLSFGLPHLVYLLLAPLAIRSAHRPLRVAFALYAVVMTAHAVVGPLLPLRLLMGVALTWAYVSLNDLIGNCVKPEQAGRAFGWLDSASKLAGVFAGLLAGALVRTWGPSAPFACAAVLAGGLTLAVPRR